MTPPNAFEPRYKRGAAVWIATVAWSGTHHYRAVIVRETPKHLRVRMTSKACLPSKGWVPAGTEALVPKQAVRLKKPRRMHVRP